MAHFETLPTSLVDALPEPRRSLHRRAVDVASRFERDGTPFALILKTFGAVQFFTESGLQGGDVFENLVFDQLEPADIGVIEVQVPDPRGAGSVLYDSDAGDMAVRAPSLYIGTDNWLAL